MRTNRSKRRSGHTLVRLTVVFSIIGVLIVGLGLPALEKATGGLPFLDNLKQQASAMFGYLGAFSHLSGSFRSPTSGPRLPWSTPSSPYVNQQNSPYLEHSGLSDGYGQPSSSGSALPWMQPSSPYVDHGGL